MTVPAGRVAVVTGAATGIGLAVTLTLARAGARVIANDIDTRALNAAESAWAGAPIKVEAVTGDVSDAEDVKQLIAAAERHTGSVDVLVNNAAVHVAKPLASHTVADWDRVIAINLRGTFLTMRAVVPAMKRCRSGSIVNFSSVAALGTSTTHAAYAASKAGIIALTRDAAVEFAPWGVRVNAVAPGPTVTQMTGELDRDAVAARIPLGRWAEPREIAAAVAYLASDEASFVTGVTMPVAGGTDLVLAYGASAAVPS